MYRKLLTPFIVANVLGLVTANAESVVAASFKFAESSLATGDAGELIPDAVELSAGITQITGKLWAEAGQSSGYNNGIYNDRADLFKFYWGGGQFQAQTYDKRLSPHSLCCDLDTQLFLFNVGTERDSEGNTIHPLGLGLASNDDIGYVHKNYSNNLRRIGTDRANYNNSRLDVYLAPGQYYLGISTAFYDPVDASGYEIFDDIPFPDQHYARKGSGVLAGYGGAYADDFLIDGRYGIYFNTATVDVLQTPEPMTVLGSLLAGAGGIYLKKKKKAQSQ